MGCSPRSSLEGLEAAPSRPLEAAVVEAARFLHGRAGEPLRLGDVADHVGHSPFHRARAFEQQVGMPPGRFLAAKRFQRAKELLLEAADERVVDVCMATGFSAPGSFAASFARHVGVPPAAFRRLPDLLADAPPRPVAVPGPARPGEGTDAAGTVAVTEAARASLGAPPVVYVGLFPRRAARGFAVAGALLAGPGPFVLTGVPPGTYHLLASALSSRADLPAQLVPPRTVAGRWPSPIRVGPGGGRVTRDLVLDLLPESAPPVLVALSLLASPIAQDWRRPPPSRSVS